MTVTDCLMRMTMATTRKTIEKTPHLMMIDHTGEEQKKKKTFLTLYSGR